MDRHFFEKDPVLRDIFNHLGDAVYFIDSHGAILFMNKAAEILDGYTFEEARGRTVTELYGLDKTTSPLLHVASSKEPLCNHAFRYYVNNQDVYQVCNTFPIHLSDGTCGAFSIQRDMTKLKQTIENNIKLQKQLFDFREKSSGEGQKGDTLYHFDDIIGEHQRLKECKTLAYNAAQSNSPIMLSGLTGTGKELFAQSIHSASPRRNETFLAINCAAIPESLLEGILFGTVKGVYTGASDRKGLFEEANGGTLFLDEINSMPLSSQSKLLRVLEEKYVQPLGSKERIRIDTRIISSCNTYPQEAMEKKQIREDLFYRLAVVNILIPPLKERKSDIFLLAHHFIAKYNAAYGKNVLAMEDDITTFFLDYDWPGNVRQLKHCIECAVNLVSPGETTIKEKHLPFYIKENKPKRYYLEFQNIDKTVDGNALSQPFQKETPSSPVYFSERLTVANAAAKDNIVDAIEEKEKENIIQAMLRNGGNISKSARDLGMSRQTLTYRMKKYGIYQERRHRKTKA